jgi:1-acyl-sn-glycerol-3-phosphate acyltransferase
LLYQTLKIIVGLALRIFCRKIIINKPELLKEKGPLLIASNHPNSFLDSVIMDVMFKEPVWSLARGDAFINRFVKRIFRSLKMFPVYRTSEGVENLSENYRTFDACLDIFKKNGIVMIFSEGKCINEWHLRPLKKGTARLAISAWSARTPSEKENIPLRILPLGINYSSFKKFGKNVFINFGTVFSKNDIDMDLSEGLRHQAFNDKLKEQLQQLVFEIDKNDKQKQKELFEIKQPTAKKILLFIPAIIGWLVHAPLYYPVKLIVRSKTKFNDHYDSMMLVLLTIKYPFYLLLIVLLLYFFFIKAWWVFLLLLVLPFTAWSYVQVKRQTGN